MSLSLPHIGALPAGVRNSIADVAGVTVGHATLAGGAIQTGVTVVRPHAGDPFLDKVPAASVVLNGFGKSIGLVQVADLRVSRHRLADLRLRHRTHSERVGRPSIRSSSNAMTAT